MLKIFFDCYIIGIKHIVEGVLILQKFSLKLKMVVDNANLRNYAVSSENISKCIKSTTENGFHLKRNVCKFRRNKSRTENQSHRRHLSVTSKKGGNSLPPGEVYQCYYSAITHIRVHNTESPRAILFKVITIIRHNRNRQCKKLNSLT